MRAEEQVTEDRHELDFGGPISKYERSWSAEARAWLIEVFDNYGEHLGTTVFVLPKDTLMYVTIGRNCLVVVFQRICPP